MISQSEYQTLKDFFENRTGMRIQQTLDRSVQRHITQRLEEKAVSLSVYLTTLDADINEQHKLINSVTISETYFFREYKYFKLLEEIILPEFKNNHIRQKLILWSAASSIGVEAVSLVLLCKHYFSEHLHRDYKVFASDIDQIALHSVFDNCFGDSMLKEDGNCYHNLIGKNAKKTIKGYVFAEEILSKIEVFPFNLVRDDYNKITFKAHIIFLRNVLTYMNFETKDIVINSIIDVLLPGGYLIPSSSDTVFISHPTLVLEEYNNIFYFKKI
jgi:chemotaxis protein methyltransferase CheR